MSITSEVWQGADLFLQRIDNGIFNDTLAHWVDEHMDDECSVGSNITSFATTSDICSRDGTNMNIELESYGETNVDLVGLQIWKGAFFLADFIIMNSETFVGKHVLELAAGTGITSIVATLVGKDQLHAISGSLICTDVDRGPILPLIRRNFKRNSITHKNNVLDQTGYARLPVKIAEIDFFNEETYNGTPHRTSEQENITEKTNHPARTALNENLEGDGERKKLLSYKEIQNVDIIMAADVVYDEKITSAFFKCLKTLCDISLTKVRSKGENCISGRKRLNIYLAIEKRFHVTRLKDRSNSDQNIVCPSSQTTNPVIAPNYEIFLNLLDSFIATYRDKGLVCEMEEIRPSGVVQSFCCYERVDELCLFKITID